jgi:hypothetical protein
MISSGAKNDAPAKFARGEQPRRSNAERSSMRPHRTQGANIPMHSPKRSPHRSPDSPDAHHSTSLQEPGSRQHPRYTVQVPVEIFQEGIDLPVRCETTDLSRSGCYIHLLVPFPVGIRLHATLWLDGQPLIIRGLIVTRHPDFGNGIMFVGFEDRGETILKRYLEAITSR